MAHRVLLVRFYGHRGRFRILLPSSPGKQITGRWHSRYVLALKGWAAREIRWKTVVMRRLHM